MSTPGMTLGVDLERSLDAPVRVCMPVQPSVQSDAEQRCHLGSIRIDFMDTHPAYCTANSRAFCYARCEILGKMMSKMLRGTAAVALTATRSMADTGEETILIVCNGIVIGRVSGDTAAILASAIAAGELALMGGRAPSWSEADFDIFLLGPRKEATESEWTSRLFRCNGFEPHVWAEKRDCSSGSCECC
uniref:Uncharacterized protein n=1 Tax=Calcidiscus leptoporus TaxID=127549 RepID=A0A7S0JII1_9EUKA|mmetsp:Transcript_58564/g.134374  ORF Transcript_58564/g.134374 Transcript_58564/m.134374 type:complete len:190 (+) Transcript_58564:87-656(+)